MPSDLAPRAHKAPLVVARFPLAIRHVAPPLALALAAIVGDLWYSGGIGIGTSLWTVVCAGLALWGLLLVLKPPRLVADEEGIIWSASITLVRIPWEDIDEIAVTRRKDVGVIDTPVARALAPQAVRTSKLLGGPLIGIRYRADRSRERDPGKRAYLRGFTGYDISIPDQFGAAPGAIVEALNARLGAARDA